MPLVQVKMAASFVTKNVAELSKLIFEGTVLSYRPTDDDRLVKRAGGTAR